MSRTRLGFLGGAFCPPHQGHLALACSARDQLKLDRVLMAPVAFPPHRDIPGDPGFHERLALLRELIGSEPKLEASPIEIGLPRPSYTWRTLQLIESLYPSCDVYLVIGADEGAKFTSWSRHDLILRLAKLAVGARAGTTTAENKAVDELQRSHPERVVRFDPGIPALSSTAIRMTARA